ncbi:MAG TPA: glycine--tRNA ligase subunit beta [Candidatus Polarisedimenticolaceae bacterium]|nr:glycine--tRNA ligase subunit beta [Candidatus Polarisedimenticolaceae bacterium]
MKAPLLVEIGCEEIPARMIAAASRDLTARLLGVLDGAGIPHGTARGWGGTRRLAVHVADVEGALPGRDETVLGPPASVAFDAEGKPTQAGAGFAKKQGIDPSALVKIENEKGAYAGFRRSAPGKTVVGALADALPSSVAAMSFPKTMRWGDGKHRWVRPVHWVVALHGDEVLDLEILGARSGRTSDGHRFLAPGPVTIDHADRYVDALRAARVLVEAGERRRVLADALAKAAATAGGVPVADEALLDEIVELVEWPGVVVGRFETAFLSLPREILVTTLRHHQKAFSVEAGGALVPAFLAVANTDRDPAGHVRRGNEWVVVGRLDDAKFFWAQDAERSLASRVPDLERVVFHQKVGTYAALTAGIGKWTSLIANELKLDSADKERTRQAAELCKADLVTGLVGEFPELQGVIGGLLLRNEGGDAIVADAVADQYLPTGPDSPLPRTDVGCVLALAERIHTVQQLLRVGEMPTGSRDPFGLRRAANAILRILIERRWPIQFSWILQSETETRFWMDRLPSFLVEQGFTISEVRAVLMVGDSGASFTWPLHAIVERLRALRSMRQSQDFATLLLLTKRIHNIVPQVAQLELKWIDEGWLPQPANYDQYTHPEPAAHALREALASQQPKIERAADAGDYETTILELAALAGPVSKFFDDVLVIDEAQRNDTHHRSQLVGRLGSLLTRYFDIRELAGQADAKR